MAEQLEVQDAGAQESKPLGPRKRSPLQVVRQRSRKLVVVLEAAALLAEEQQPAAHSHSAEVLQPAHSAALPAAAGDE